MTSSNRSNHTRSSRNHRFDSFDNFISPMDQDGPIQLSFVPPMTRPGYYRQLSRESHRNIRNSHAPREDPNDRIEVFSDSSDSPRPLSDGYHSEIESFGDQDEAMNAAVNEAPPPVERNESFDFDAPLFTPNSQYQPTTQVFGTPSPPYSPRTPGWALGQDTPEFILNSDTEADTLPYDPDEPPTQEIVQQQQPEPLRRELSQNFVDDNSQIVLTQLSQPQQLSASTREQTTQASLDLPESQQTNKAATQSTLDKHLNQTSSQSVEELFEGLSQGSALSACKSTQELSSQPSGSQSQKGFPMEYRRVVKNGDPPISSQDASQHNKEGKSSQPWLKDTQGDDSPKDIPNTSQSQTRVGNPSQQSSSGSSKENKNRSEREQSIQTYVKKADQSIQCSPQPWSTLQMDTRKQSKKAPQSRKRTKSQQGSSSRARPTNTVQSSLSDYYQPQVDGEQKHQQSDDETSNSTSASSSSSVKISRSKEIRSTKSTPKQRLRLGLSKNVPASKSPTLPELIAKRNEGNRRQPQIGIVNHNRQQQ